MDNGLAEVREPLNQALGKTRVFLMNIKWFVPAVFASASMQWLVLEPFGLADRIFQKGGIAPWLYFFFICILSGALTAALKSAHYYRGVYRLYRANAYVDNLYADRSTIQGKYHSLIEETTTEFAVFGMSLHTLLQNRRNRDLIVKRAIERNVNFKFLIHHPDCQYIKARARAEGKRESHIVEDCELHLATLKDMRRSVKESRSAKGTIEIRTIKDKIPDCFYLLKDDTLYIEPYLQDTTGRDCPVFSLKRNEINKPAFLIFSEVMSHKWKEASEIL